MSRFAFALYTVLVGLLMGVAGNLLFYGKLIGLSLPLFIGLGVVVVLISARLMRINPHPRNLLLLAPLMFFAGMVAVRDDPLITVLNILAVLGLGALVVYYLPHPRPFDRDSLADYGAAAGEASLSILITPVAELVDAGRWLRRHRQQQGGRMVAVGRGLLLALPVVIVFALLLSSADTVFADMLGSVFQLIDVQTVDALLMQGALVAGLGWLACGTLAYAVARRLTAAKPAAPPPETEEAVGAGGDIRITPSGAAVLTAAPPRKRQPLILGMIESGIMLASVDLLFGAFVAVQFAYFFGGETVIGSGSLTYAQYARRGFFELVAVSILTLGLVLMLDWVTVRHDRRQIRLFRGLSVVLVALTGVMLVSASRRMLLYEEAYGFTQLRVYTHVFMLWLGALFVVFLLALFRVRENIFAVGALLVVIGYGMTLNGMNVELYIAQRNVERALQGKELDMPFLFTFSADATPAMLNLYRAAKDDALREAAGQWLAHQLWRLDGLRQGEGATVFSTNLSRDFSMGELEWDA